MPASGTDFPFTPPPPSSAVAPPILSEGDPGAVGTGRIWIIPSTGATRVRNALNTGWIVISATAATPTLGAVLAAGNVASAKIVTLTNPTAAQDAATKSYVDARTLAQVLVAGNNAGAKIAGVTDPTLAQDAATKAYVDAAISVRIVRGSVAADGSIVSGTGYTVTKGSAGVYTLNYTVAFTGAPLVVIQGYTDNLTFSATGYLVTSAAGSCLLNIREGGSVTLIDAPFDFLAVSV